MPKARHDFILLSNNPTSGSRWTDRTGRTADVGFLGYWNKDSWSVTCNLPRISRGTLGIICRNNGSLFPDVAGLILVAGEPKLYVSRVRRNGKIRVVEEWYVRGPFWGLPQDLWIPGPDIAAAGWPQRRAPWGGHGVQFRGGVSLDDHLAGIILELLDEGVLELFRHKYEALTGGWPTW